MDRTPSDEPPPVILAIVGPPGVRPSHISTSLGSLNFSRFLQVGKTTLVKSLVKRYTKSTLTEAKGPITVVTGTYQRMQYGEIHVSDVSSLREKTSPHIH